MNNESKRILTEEGIITEGVYAFIIKPSFSTLGSVLALSSEITGSQNVTLPMDNSIGDLLGFKPVKIHEGYNLSDHLVDILSFDNSFLETDIAQGMIFKGKRTGTIFKWVQIVNLRYKSPRWF